MSNMVIATNVLSLNSHRSLKGVGGAQAKSSERLSSGYRINRAADDAAGLAISEKMRSQIRGLDQASRNAQDGISLIQTAEGALQESENMLQRMRELTVQASNGTLQGTDVDKVILELNQLSEEITAATTKTEFNGAKLIDGTFEAGKELYLQIGANEKQGLKVAIEKMDAVTLEVDKTKVGDVIKAAASREDVSSVTKGLDSAIEKVSTQRAQLGAYQNRLEHTIKNLDTSSENLSASESRIRDTDMAKEMMKLTQNNVLAQAATSMLAQANQAPQSILKLLG